MVEHSLECCWISLLPTPLHTLHPPSPGKVVTDRLGVRGTFE